MCLLRGAPWCASTSPAVEHFDKFQNQWHVFLGFVYSVAAKFRGVVVPAYARPAVTAPARPSANAPESKPAAQANTQENKERS